MMIPIKIDEPIRSSVAEWVSILDFCHTNCYNASHISPPPLYFVDVPMRGSLC